jgi:nucleoside-diphosphate-sugar epimerase
LLYLKKGLQSISILGSGWLGKPLGAALSLAGYNVNGSTTSPAKLDELSSLGINPFLINLVPEITGETGSFFDCHVLVISIPPRTRQNTGEHYLHQIDNIIAGIQKGTGRRIVFISSTSVYPDSSSVVTENDADQSALMVRAEKLFIRNRDFNVAVLRFGGLVGPGRHPGKFLSGKNVAAGSNPVNIIHLDDCISIIRTIIETECWNDIFNACADTHPTRREFYNQACKQLGVPLPVFSDVDHPYKIVSSEKLRNTLNYRFHFPDPMKMTY